MNFVDKAEKMKSVVGKLSADPDISKILSFRPPKPEVCLVHAIIDATKEEVTRVEKEVAEETGGVHVFSRLRGNFQGDSSKQYFEWNMGDVNGAVEDIVFIDAWRLFASKLIDSRRYNDL